MMSTGKLIILAFPDTFVKTSDEWKCKLLPLVGLGTFKEIKAGHAAMVLIENKTGKANYYDFGRYVAPKGFGRVRSVETDAELEIPIKAQLIGNGPLDNLDKYLRWLSGNSKKTHGSGRMIASVCEEINFEKAQTYILNLQNCGFVPYRAFGKEGSNCARFVTETILAATENNEIKKELNRIKKFTPSPIGNVAIAASSETFEVLNGVIVTYKGSILKENLTNYFHRRSSSELVEKKELPSLPKNAQKISGIGSNAWFTIAQEVGHSNLYKIKRFNDFHEVDYVGLFETDGAFNIYYDYKFIHGSNCKQCSILQDGTEMLFYKVQTCPEFAELQKAISA